MASGYHFVSKEGEAGFPICSFLIITKHFTQCKYSFPSTAENECIL